MNTEHQPLARFASESRSISAKAAQHPKATVIEMSTQYNDIGQRYSTFADLPSPKLEKPSILAILGDVTGLRCLDLACGLGQYARLLIERGASSVLGLDISDSMILGAREALSALSPEEDRAKVEFRVQDCGKPFEAEGGPFDLVLAIWLLDEASHYAEMLAMWQNVWANLKPGGRFIALTNNTFVPRDLPWDPRYGITSRVLNKTDEGGWKCRVTAFTQPEVMEFDYYHYQHDFYERAAKEAGFQGVRWHSHRLPGGQEWPEGYWDVLNLQPHFCLCSAIRSEHG